jgi:hypothetical protein
MFCYSFVIISIIMIIYIIWTQLPPFKIYPYEDQYEDSYKYVDLKTNSKCNLENNLESNLENSLENTHQNDPLEDIMKFTSYDSINFDESSDYNLSRWMKNPNIKVMDRNSYIDPHPKNHCLEDINVSIYTESYTNLLRDDNSATMIQQQIHRHELNESLDMSNVARYNQSKEERYKNKDTDIRYKFGLQ